MDEPTIHKIDTAAEAERLESMRKERQGPTEASLAAEDQRLTGPDWMTGGVMETALRDAAAGPFVAEVLRLREVASALVQECRDRDEALHQMAAAHMMTKRKLAEAQARIVSVVDLHADIAEREANYPSVGLSTFVRNPANGAMVAADELLIDSAACASQFRQLTDDAELRQAIKDNICTPLRKAAEGTVRCCQEYAANELEWFASMLRKGLGPIPNEKGQRT